MNIITDDIKRIANALAGSADELRTIGEEKGAMSSDLAASILRGFLRLPSAKMNEIHLLGLGLPAGIVQALVQDVQFDETTEKLTGMIRYEN